MDILSWVFVVVALIGNYYINKQKICGYYFWILSNIFFVGYNVTINNYSMSFLFLVYIVFCIHGVLNWKKEKK